MNSRIEAFQELKRVHLEIVVPDALDDIIRRGISEGRTRTAMITPRGHAKTGYGAVRAAAALAAAMMILIVSLNLSPAFAEQLSGIPILGQLVKVLIFTGGAASGGAVTDGTDISAVSTAKNGAVEAFTLHFEQEERPQDIAGAYMVQYGKNPDTLSFQISGVRMFSATSDFDAMKKSALVEDVYPIMTLDDSMVRFMIVFKASVIYEVKEMKAPASLVLQVSPGIRNDSDVQLYRVRTAEMPRGESLAITEEMLMNTYPQRRILHASGGAETFFIELGQFESKKDAEKVLETAKAACPDAGMLIEAIPLD